MRIIETYDELPLYVDVLRFVPPQTSRSEEAPSGLPQDVSKVIKPTAVISLKDKRKGNGSRLKLICRAKSQMLR